MPIVSVPKSGNLDQKFVTLVKQLREPLHKLGFDEVQETRIGKMIELQMDPVDADRVDQMCRTLLANPVIENYRIEVQD